MTEEEELREALRFLEEYGDAFDGEGEDSAVWDSDSELGLNDQGLRPHGPYDTDTVELWLKDAEGRKNAATQLDGTLTVGVDQTGAVSVGTHQDWTTRAGTLASKTFNVITPSKWRLKSMCRLPSHVCTCKDSALVTKAWENSFGGNNSVKSMVYFNFELDTLYLDGRTFLEKSAADGIKNRDPHFRYDLRNLNKYALAKVKSLALNWDDWFDYELSLSWMLGYFPGVERITMVIDDSKVDFNLSDLCFTSIKSVDSNLSEYEDNPQWYLLDDQELKESLNDKYQSMFDRADFEFRLREEIETSACRY